MKLLIYGAGGLARVVYDNVMRNTPNKYEKIYFIDDFSEEKPFYYSETIHFDSIRKIFSGNFVDIEAVVAVGEPVYREKLTGSLEEIGVRLATIIDKTSIISPSAKIEDGCIICEQTIVDANSRVARGALIQPYSAIGHDSKVGRFSVVSSGCVICGDVDIGDRSFVGVNSSVKEKISVGNDVIIAMGSVVLSNIDSENTVFGNPARITKGNSNHKVFG